MTPSIDNTTYALIVVAGLLLLSAGANLGTIIRSFTNRKERREVSFEIPPASKDEFDKHTAWDSSEHKALWDRINTEKKDAADAVRVRHDKLYGHIDEIRLELKMDIASLRESVDDKIEALPDRVIATLKNTGALDRHSR
jgi:hypothetical protein